MSKFRKIVETNVFGVCTYLGDKIGIPTRVIRIYFIYATFFAFGSPIVLYLALAFWINLKRYIRPKRQSVWDL